MVDSAAMACGPRMYPAHTRTTWGVIEGAESRHGNGREGKGGDDAVSVWKWALWFHFEIDLH